MAAATSAPARRAFAPTYGQREDVVDHGFKDTKITLSVPIASGAGSGTICPDTIAKAVGVANPDFANVHAVTINNVTHNLGDDIAIVAGLRHGNGDAIDGAPKHHMVVTNAGKTAHVLTGNVVGVSGSSNHDQRIEIAPEATTPEAAETMQMSAAKWLRWGKEADQLRKADCDKHFINHDVRVAEMASSTPGEAPQVRVLVPHEPNEQSSVFTKYFHMMKNSADFHDSAYADESANTVKIPNDDGTPITYATMEKADYDTTLPSLTEKLKPHSELEKKKGIKATLVTSAPRDGMAHIQMTLHRTPTATVLHQDMCDHSLAEADTELPHLLEEHLETAYGTGEAAAPLATNSNAQMTSIFGDEGGATGSSLTIKPATAVTAEDA